MIRRARAVAHFKLIELILSHDDRPQEEAAFAALAVPGNRLTNLFSAGMAWNRLAECNRLPHCN
jgi:hypothetical protein